MGERLDRGAAYQIHLGESAESLKALVKFNKGTTIYPSLTSRGVLQGVLFARKESGEVHGLSRFTATSRAELYLDHRTWFINEGDEFGAFASKVRKVSQK